MYKNKKIMLTVKKNIERLFKKKKILKKVDLKNNEKTQKKKIIELIRGMINI